jgi:hypothetical protein
LQKLTWFAETLHETAGAGRSSCFQLPSCSLFFLFLFFLFLFLTFYLSRLSRRFFLGSLSLSLSCSLLCSVFSGLLFCSCFPWILSLYLQCLPLFSWPFPVSPMLLLLPCILCFSFGFVRLSCSLRIIPYSSSFCVAFLWLL